MARSLRRRSRQGNRRLKQRRQNAPILPSSAPLDSAKLKQLYSTMLGSRMLAERVRLLTPEIAFPPDTSVITGHEAVEVGSLLHLIEEDCVASAGRGYVAHFIRGARPRWIFADLCREARGEALLGTLGAEKNVDSVLPCSPLAVQMNQLTGAAWAFKMQKRPQVALFLSSNQFSSIDWLRDAVGFSAKYKLPTIFVIENARGDRLHVADPGRESRRPEEAAFHDPLPCFAVDGNDAVAVYRVAQEAIRRARQGHGPAWIESRPWAGPSRSGPTTVLNSDGLEDPLSRMETHLQSKGLWSDKWKTRLVEKFKRQLDQASRSLQRKRETSMVSSAPVLHPRGTGPAKTTEANVFETPVIRDSGRLAGGRS